MEGKVMHSELRKCNVVYFIIIIVIIIKILKFY